MEGPVSQALIDRFVELEAREKRADETAWAKEIVAQECGRVFESLWDSLNAATNKFELLASFPVGEVILGDWRSSEDLVHGIELRASRGAGAALSPSEWRRLLEDFARDGWQIEHVEFRHNRFDLDAAGRPERSGFYFSAHLANPSRGRRAAIDGDLTVDWSKERGQEPRVKRIDASRLAIHLRSGEPPFRQVFETQLKPPRGSYFIDPLILYDLDGDGTSEIILAASNTLFRRREGDRYESEPFCRHDPGLVFTGCIADFDGDGAADFLCAKFEGLVLFKGSLKGTFDEPGALVWSVNPHLKYAQVLTCADIDHDGDLDVWLGQYKPPFTRGQMPTPCYDANDGYPAYLLLNDGRGNFKDATAAAGLEKKRWRRTYSGSFADLDSDGSPDLVVVSDFAGVDLYKNDGRGHFTDVTGRWLDEPHAAGMAHAITDVNRDGLLDLLVIGMHSPTVDRLAHQELTRPGLADDAALHTELMHGNRLYLGQRAGGFRQGALSGSIARSGWSWGCSAFDFDNDSYPDVYIANGHETKQSVRDYESEFWLHDIYVGDSKEDVAVDAFFRSKFDRTRGRGQSYGGYEKNRLYLNRGGTSFFEAGYVMGVALEEDCRNVVADDLDGDGRADLLVTTFEAWPEVKQTLHIFKNTLQQTGNWIGFRLREEGSGVSPVGARVTLRYGDCTTVQQIVTGDSYRSQHANTVHFGLGNAQSVDNVEVKWVNGRTVTLTEPAINRYHDVRVAK